MTQSRKTEILAFLHNTHVGTMIADIRLQALLVEYHYEIFGTLVDCPSCPGKLEGYVSRMKRALVNPNFIPKSIPMNYKLKTGKRIYSRYAKMVITNDNITEGNAVALLAENPDNEKLFEKVADDWKEKAKKYRDTRESLSQKAVEQKKAAAQAKKANLEAAAVASAQRKADHEQKATAKAAAKPAEPAESAAAKKGAEGKGK